MFHCNYITLLLLCWLALIDGYRYYVAFYNLEYEEFDILERDTDGSNHIPDFRIRRSISFYNFPFSSHKNQNMIIMVSEKESEFPNAGQQSCKTNQAYQVCDEDNNCTNYYLPKCGIIISIYYTFFSTGW